MKKIKTLAGIISFFLLLASLSFGFYAAKELLSLPTASDYTDEGVHTFIPRSAYPTQKETYHARRHTTKRVTTQTVYKITYRTTDGSGYTWVVDTLISSEADRIVKEKKAVDRRVLVTKDNTYITIDAKETAESYIKSIRKKDIFVINLVGAYILIYGAVKLIMRQRKKWAEDTE